MTVDAPSGQKAIPRYIFGPGKKGERLSDFVAGRFDAPKGMTEQQALVSFLQWASEHAELEIADHYALILWGHGPQLLMQPPPAPGCQDVSLYLTPGDLRDALQKVAVVPTPHKGIKFDLIGFDACSMSLVEVAYELREHVKYMVASQEEVPDLSFPYDTIVSLFRQGGDNVEEMLRQGVYKYIQTYIDYITDAVTEMTPATLTALRLVNCSQLEDALCELVRAFGKAEKESGLAALLIAARERTRDFVSGLYVDLADLAAELMNILNAGANTTKGGYGGQVPAPGDVSYWRYAIYEASKKIIEALEEDTDGTHSSALVLANCSTDGACNGGSLYMPYLSNDQWIDMSRPMFKGGDPSRGGKDFSSVLNDVAPQQLLHARHTLIKNTESYYEDLALSQDTGWYKFIVEQWTPILVRMASRDLNVVYSATQAARNVCRESKVRATPKCKELPA
nr:clostripain-related cysteine peptidase [Granulicella aggregans]